MNNQFSAPGIAPASESPETGQEQVVRNVVQDDEQVQEN